MQAVLIIAHRDLQQVVSLAELMHQKFEVYIHFDKKMTLPDDTQEKLSAEGIHYYQQIDVHWGGWSIGQVAVNLMKEALKNPEITYFHVISGQDWPLQPIDKIYDYFEHTNKVFMTFFKAKDVKKTGEPVIWWQKYYFHYDEMNRRTLYGKLFHRFSLIIQTLLRVNKFNKLGINLEIYSGANWCDLPRDVTSYALKYLDNHPELLQMLKTGCFSDEFWMQTIICNSQYKERICPDIHRYIVMEKKHGSRPAILDDADYAQIVEGNYFWGRKFVRPYSSELMSKLNKETLKKGI